MEDMLIVETDSHGGGIFYSKGKVDYYHYDDGDCGDLKSCMEYLMKYEIIPKDKVKIYTIEEAIEKLGEYEFNS